MNKPIQSMELPRTPIQDLVTKIYDLWGLDKTSVKYLFYARKNNSIT